MVLLINIASRVAERLKTWDLRKLGNVGKVSKLRLVPSLPEKFRKTAIKLFP